MSDPAAVRGRENRTLQASRIFAAAAVLFIHCGFPGIFGDLVRVLARFAVPLFFCISGRYFLPVHDNAQDLTPSVIRRQALRRLKNLLRILIPVYIVYTLFSLFTRLSAGETIPAWAADRFSRGEWFTFFVFQSGKVVYDYTYTFDHLWYLFAEIYIYILLFVLAPVVLKTFRFFTVLLMLGLYFGILLQIVYPIRPFDISIRTWYVLRNWLLMGLPFTGLGIWSRRGFPGKLRFASLHAGIALIIAGVILSLAEWKIIEDREIYLGSLLVVLGILALADAEEDHPRKSSDRKHAVWDLLVFAGRELSGNVYFWHVLLFAVLIRFTFPLEVYDLWLWIRPPVLLILSLCLAWVLWYTKKRLSSANQRL